MDKPSLSETKASERSERIQKALKGLLEAAKRGLNCLIDQVEGQHTTKDALIREIKQAEEALALDEHSESSSAAEQTRKEKP